MMMVQYLLDADADARIPGVAAPETSFADIVAPVALALEQERRVSEQIDALAGVAREEGDFQSEQFMQWFLKEQVEEVATMSDLLRVVERSRDNPMDVEEYLAREHGSATAERPDRAAAPPAAPSERACRRAARRATEPAGQAQHAHAVRPRSATARCPTARASTCGQDYALPPTTRGCCARRRRAHRGSSDAPLAELAEAMLGERDGARPRRSQRSAASPQPTRSATAVAPARAATATSACAPSTLGDYAELARR